MHTTIRRAVRAVAPATALVVAVGLAGPASAGKPIRPAVPTDVAVASAAVTLSGGAYSVPTSWKAGANDASYLVSITAGTTTLASATVTRTSWTPSVHAKAGTAIKVSVQGVYGGRRSAAATADATLPDLTAPTGAYSATWAGPTGGVVPVTLTPTSLTDDLPVAAVQVSVDWGDGSATTGTSGAQPLVHDYPMSATPRRYQPTITLTDAAGNRSYAPVNAVVVSDTTAPTQALRLSRASGWTAWTAIALTTTATDDLSPAARIKRTVRWGDGATSVAYGDRTLTHVYARAGTFHPTVTAADEALPANTSTSAGTVVIRNDVTAPAVRLLLPRSRAASVRTWRVLRGTAVDAQTAVSVLRIRVVEKRARAYYSYVPARHSWVKVGTRAKALARAGYLDVRPGATHAWAAPIRGLTKGRLVYRVVAVDVRGNLTRYLQHAQRLTRR